MVAADVPQESFRAPLVSPRIQTSTPLRGGDRRLSQEAESPHSGSGSSLSTILNILNTMVGSGIFALPFCMYLTSPTVTTITLVIVAIISYTSMLTVGVVLPGFVPGDSYHSIASKLCSGTVVVRIISYTICFSLIGVVTMLLVVSYDCFSIELSSTSSRPISGLVLAALSCGLSWPRALHGMRFISGIGVMLLISAWILILATATLGCPIHPEIPQNQHKGSVFSDASTVLGTAMLVFGCQVNLPRLYSELPPEMRPRMPFIMAASILFALIIYLVLAYAAVSSPCFGFGRSSNILLALPHTVAFTALRIGFGVISLTKIPLAVHPIRHILLESTRRSPVSPAHGFFTVAIIAVAYIFFVMFTILSDITSIVGAVGVLGSMMFFPAILLHHSNKGHSMSPNSEPLLPRGESITSAYWSSRHRRTVSVSLAVCGVIAAVITLPGILMRMLTLFEAVVFSYKFE